MSTQYRGGTFSETLPFDKAFSNFQEELRTKPDQLRAFHMGSVSEIEEIKTKATLQSQIDSLAERLESMEPVTSDLLHIPDKDEIKQLSKGETWDISGGK